MIMIVSLFYLEEDQNLPEENSFPSSPSLTPPIRKVEFNLDLDLISGEFELNTPTSADTCDASLNENNNNIFYAGQYNQKTAMLIPMCLDS